PPQRGQWLSPNCRQYVQIPPKRDGTLGNLRFHLAGEYDYTSCQPAHRSRSAVHSTMKKFLTALLFIAALAGTQSAQAFQVKRSTLLERLDTCEAILQDLQSSTK